MLENFIDRQIPSYAKKTRRTAESSLEINSNLAVAVVMMMVMVAGTGTCRNDGTGKNDERNGSKEQRTQLHGGTPS
jgi:hypothetical protein